MFQSHQQISIRVKHNYETKTVAVQVIMLLGILLGKGNEYLAINILHIEGGKARRNFCVHKSACAQRDGSEVCVKYVNSSAAEVCDVEEIRVAFLRNGHALVNGGRRVVHFKNSIVEIDCRVPGRYCPIFGYENEPGGIARCYVEILIVIENDSCRGCWTAPTCGRRDCNDPRTTYRERDACSVVQG